jgi:hypothetical protein
MCITAEYFFFSLDLEFGTIALACYHDGTSMEDFAGHVNQIDLTVLHQSSLRRRNVVNLTIVELPRVWVSIGRYGVLSV